MPTKAQLLELNKSLTKERDQLRTDKKQLKEELEVANGKIKSRVKPFNEMKAELKRKSEQLTEVKADLERAKLDNQNHVDNLSDLKIELANAKSDAVRFKKRIPWYKSKK